MGRRRGHRPPPRPARRSLTRAAISSTCVRQSRRNPPLLARPAVVAFMTVHPRAHGGCRPAKARSAVRTCGMRPKGGVGLGRQLAASGNLRFRVASGLFGLRDRGIGLLRRAGSWSIENHVLELSAQGDPLSERLKDADLELFPPALDQALVRIGLAQSGPVRHRFGAREAVAAGEARAELQGGRASGV